MAAGFSPLDEVLALEAGSYTPRLAALLVRLSTWLPFTQLPDALAACCRLHSSRETARRRTEAAGRVLVAVDDAASAAALEQRADLAPAADAPVPPGITLQLSVDGAMVPLVHGEWAEVKTLALGEVQPAADGGFGRTTALSYVSRLATAEAFTQTALGECLRRGVPSAARVAAVNDGAVWIQGFVDYQRPDAVRILDHPHAVEHLSAAAHASLGATGPAGRAWVAQQATELRDGDPAAVLQAVCWLPTAQAADPAAAVAARDKTLQYLAERWGQLQYATFRAAGYPIGSGSVESANKLVVEARLKGSGMHWARANVNGMLSLRAWACSDRWPAAEAAIRRQCQQRAATRRHQRCQAGLSSLPPPSAPRSPAPPVAALAQQPTVSVRPKQVLSGRPTAAHPWKRGPACRTPRALAAFRAKH